VRLHGDLAGATCICHRYVDPCTYSACPTCEDCIAACSRARRAVTRGWAKERGCGGSHSSVAPWRAWRLPLARLLLAPYASVAAGRPWEWWSAGERRDRVRSAGAPVACGERSPTPIIVMPMPPAAPMPRRPSQSPPPFAFALTAVGWAAGPCRGSAPTSPGGDVHERRRCRGSARGERGSGGNGGGQRCVLRS